MPGHNHYASCLCGWCHKTRSNGYSERHEIISAFRNFTALSTLEREGATRSWTACFVSPNASCPVCDARVFFYQNARGSRVFFDALGWPWPKHPCTDRASRTKYAKSLSAGSPRPRSRGEVLGLLDKARSVSFDVNAGFREKWGLSPWDLLEVTSIEKRGFENHVEARSISPPLDGMIRFSFTSHNHSPKVGDLIGFSGTEISLLDPEDWGQRGYKVRLF